MLHTFKVYVDGVAISDDLQTEILLGNECNQDGWEWLVKGQNDQMELLLELSPSLVYSDPLWALTTEIGLCYDLEFLYLRKYEGHDATSAFTDYSLGEEIPFSTSDDLEGNSLDFALQE